MRSIIRDIFMIILTMITGIFVYYLLITFIDSFPKEYSKIVFLIMVAVYFILKKRYKNL